jgi:formate--tetrahydrofolate ligase
VYEESLPLWEKMKAIATKIYGAADISADRKRARADPKLQDRVTGTSRCASRRPSTRSRPTRRLRGAPSGHIVNVREVNWPPAPNSS